MMGVHLTSASAFRLLAAYFDLEGHTKQVSNRPVAPMSDLERTVSIFRQQQIQPAVQQPPQIPIGDTSTAGPRWFRFHPDFERDETAPESSWGIPSAPTNATEYGT